jgi:hypothetical protein
MHLNFNQKMWAIDSATIVAFVKFIWKRLQPRRAKFVIDINFQEKSIRIPTQIVFRNFGNRTAKNVCASIPYTENHVSLGLTEHDVRTDKTIILNLGDIPANSVAIRPIPVAFGKSKSTSFSGRLSWSNSSKTFKTDFET